MSTVVVVGAGASGIIASLVSSEKNNVILLDGNDKCGKKLLLTGNGRCNYWNDDINASMYETDCNEALQHILKNAQDVLSYLDSLGIYPKIKNGYYYPYSNQATSICEIFKRQLESRKINFKKGFKVSAVAKNGNSFTITSTNGETIKCDKVILATGSKAYSKTGSDGSGYNLARSFGHSINRVCPSLTGLISEGKFLKEWEKIRSDAKVSLYADGKFIKSDTGEIQLTSTGISGICTFNVSGMASKSIMQGKSVSVSINFLPYLNNGFYSWFSSRCNNMQNVSVEQALESLFNYKLLFVLLKRAGVSKDDVWNKMSEEKRKALSEAIENFTLQIVDTEGYDKSQVCTGGVPLCEINTETMESKLTKGLYLAGELLDVDGRCGGYNLAFAFISGYISGKSV